MPLDVFLFFSRGESRRYLAAAALGGKHGRRAVRGAGGGALLHRRPAQGAARAKLARQVTVWRSELRRYLAAAALSGDHAQPLECDSIDAELGEVEGSGTCGLGQSQCSKSSLGINEFSISGAKRFWAASWTKPGRADYSIPARHRRSLDSV